MDNIEEIEEIEEIKTIEAVFLSDKFSIRYNVVDGNTVSNLVGFPMNKAAIINGRICSPSRRYSLSSLEAKIAQITKNLQQGAQG